MKTSSRFSIAILCAAAALGTSALALADTSDAKPQCGGEGKGHGKGKGAMFQKADKNGDGFLTQAEVGNERWERIKVADANKDNKVSKDELKQARKDGKLSRGKGQRA